MSEPRKETAEQPVVAPSVSADPGRGPWRLSRIPSHVGRARTSTLVLGMLFLAIGALYLNIRPAVPTATTPAGTGNVQQAPAAPEPTPTPTQEPTTTTTPETTTPGTATDDAPTTTTDPTPTEEPTETTTPEETAENSLPTFSSPSGPRTSPTVGSPPG